LLFVLFVAYYGVLVVLAVEFLLLAVGLYQSFLTSPADNWLALPAAMLMTAVVARLAVELVMGMAGLVTNKYDGANPPVFGPLLNESNSPDLQKLIALVAERTRGPLPNEIRVSPDANCYVCENRRFSLSTNRSLVLVIGLPHLTVLTATELKIILAHELAHFAGGDTRLGVFLHRFLESLRDRSGNSTVYQWQWGDPVHWLRWLYFKGAQLIAAPVWQSQELRADAASARAFGGRLAARTLLREWLLAEQFHEALEQRLLAHAVGNQNAANVYDAFAEEFRRFTPEGEQYLRRRLADEQSVTMFDSHPSIRARIDMVLTFPDRDPPDTRPARRLIGDFDVIKELMQSELLNRGECDAGRRVAASTD
jgi:Zn-dependent protease with chaperone function